MTFEDLERWKAARQLVKGIYTLTRDPRLERASDCADRSNAPEYAS